MPVKRKGESRICPAASLLLNSRGYAHSSSGSGPEAAASYLCVYEGERGTVQRGSESKIQDQLQNSCAPEAYRLHSLCTNSVSIIVSLSNRPLNP
jgi:hypothetical protein